MRIRWTDEERAVLIHAAAQAMHDKQVFSLRDSLAKAQEALPTDRRREIAALSQVPWFTTGVPAKIKELEHQAKHSVEKEIQQVVQITEQKARDALEHQIAQFLGKILAKAIKHAIHEPELAPIFSASAVTIPEPIKRVVTQRVKLPRVVIAGMLNSQAKTVEAAFSGKLDLRFWSKDQSADTLKKMLAHADSVIGMVGFLAHSHDAILKSSKIPYTPVSGGVTQVKQALERLLET